MKYIIYKSLGNYYVTDFENYNAYIRNERKVKNFSEFDSPQSIIEYWHKYFDHDHEDTFEVLA